MRALTAPALLLAVPLWIWWAVAGGGYATTDWAGGLWWLAGVAALHALAGRRARRPGRLERVALAAALFLVGWSALSLLWADDRGAAWQAAERRALYALAFALPLLWPPARETLRRVVGAYPLLAAVALASGIVTALGDPGSLVDGRLTEPAGYPNANAALFVGAALVALANAARAPARAAGARAAGLGLAVLALSGMLLTQSRGGAAATGVAALALLAAGPWRGRLLVAYALAGAAFAAVVPFLLDVRRAHAAGDLDPTLRGAVAAVLVAAVAAGLGGVVWSLVARRRPERPPRPLWPGPRAAALAGGLVVVALVAGGIAGRGWIGDRVDDFRTPAYGRVESGDTRFGGGLGSNRADYWRVAVDLGGERPLTGFGAENFHAPYLVRRHSDRSPLFAHQAWLEALALLGVPGLLALLAFAVAAGLALLGRAAAAPVGERALLVAAGTPAATLALFASWDWVDYVGLVTVPALGLLGAALGAREHAVPAGARSGPTLAAGAVLAALLAVPLSASARLVDEAERAFGRAGAPAIAARAGRWDPLSPVPGQVEGVAALAVGDRARAERAFRAALTRDETLWFAHLELGLIGADRQGSDRRALAHLRRAHALNPRDPLPRRALRRLEAGRSPGDPYATARRALRVD